MVQELDSTNRINGYQGMSNSLLIEAVAYLDVIQQKLEERYPMDRQPPEWISRAQNEIQEAKEEIKNLLNQEASLAQLAVNQHMDDLRTASDQASQWVWDNVNPPRPPAG